MKQQTRLMCLLALCLLLIGCQNKSKPSINLPQKTNKPADVEYTVAYDWMAGESPVRTKRICTLRASVNNPYFAVSPTGCYFIQSTTGSTDSFILYVDNGTDTMVKLCGRPDCNHSDSDCNAYLYYGSMLSYYNGYLYAVSGAGASSGRCELVRMEPDGTERVILLDLLAFADAHGGDYVQSTLIANGYFLFSVYAWKDSGAGSLSGTWVETYVYKLDGSLDEPQAVDADGAIIYNCGDVFLAYRNGAQNGGQYGSYWNWDPETDSTTYLTDHPGQPGWFDEKEAYYFKDGAICRLTYATQSEEVMVDTGLEGKYYLFVFPDCMVVASSGIGNAPDNQLYIYNWTYELVDVVRIPNATNVSTHFLLIAETAEWFVLTDTVQGLPKYYINKAELGTGEVKVHAFRFT